MELIVSFCMYVCFVLPLVYCRWTPSGFCNSSGVSIDVSETGIQCYSGCLTSTNVLVTGTVDISSGSCRDGKNLRNFLLIVSFRIVLAVACTLGYDWVTRREKSLLGRLSSGT